MKKSLTVIVMACLLAVSLTITPLFAAHTLQKDRVAVGWLTIPLDRPENMIWGNTTELSDYNQRLISMGVKGHIGDRDSGEILGRNYTLQEANLLQPKYENINYTLYWSSWRIFLYDHFINDFTMLNIKTHKGSTSFGNPAFTFLKSPNNKSCIIITYFLFSEGANDGEAGQLIFYTELESVPVTKQEIESIFEDVTQATANRYDAKDNRNRRLDTIKIIEKPGGGYLGIHHSKIGGRFYVRLATSADLLNWTFSRTVEENASQPTIAQAPNGAYIIAFEKHLPNGEHHLGFQYYADLQSLLCGITNREMVANLTLGDKTGLEGTPNIYSITVENSKMLVRVGFHYNCLTESPGPDFLVVIAIVIAVITAAAIIIYLILTIKKKR